MTAVATEYLERPALTALQCRRLCALLREVVPANRFYAGKLAAAGVRPEQVTDLDGLRRLPFTTKAELLASQAERPPYGDPGWSPPTAWLRYRASRG